MKRVGFRAHYFETYSALRGYSGSVLATAVPTQLQRRLIQLRRRASASWRRLLARCTSDSRSGLAVSPRMAPIIELPSRAERQELGDAGRDEADDEERRGERERELAPGLGEPEQRSEHRRQGGEEQSEQPARAKPLQRDLCSRSDFVSMGESLPGAPEVGWMGRARPVSAGDDAEDRGPRQSPALAQRISSA